MIDPMTYCMHVRSNRPDLRVYEDQSLAPPRVGNIQDSMQEGQVGPESRGPSRGPMSTFGMPPGRHHQNEDIETEWQSAGPPRDESGPWAEYDNIIPGSHTRSLELIDNSTGQPDNSRYLMCPPEVIGFDLKSRIWRKYYAPHAECAITFHPLDLPTWLFPIQFGNPVSNLSHWTLTDSTLNCRNVLR